MLGRFTAPAAIGTGALGDAMPLISRFCANTASSERSTNAVRF
jgi:hypothetical protein